MYIMAKIGARLLPMTRPDCCLYPLLPIETLSLFRQRRTSSSKSSLLRACNSQSILYSEKKRRVTVKMLGVSPSISFRGIDQYKLHTSRLDTMLETNWQHWTITITREENKQPQLMVNQGTVY